MNTFPSIGGGRNPSMPQQYFNQPLSDYVGSKDDPFTAIVQRPINHDTVVAAEFGRPQRPLSEHGTLPDSAYGTGSAGERQSIGRPSLYNGSTASGSTLGLGIMEGLQLDSLQNPFAPSASANIPQVWASGSYSHSVSTAFEVNSASGANEIPSGSGGNTVNTSDIDSFVGTTVGGKFTCKICGHLTRTKSEMQKHVHRHLKPFKCDFRDCKKSKYGFATSSDLKRHRTSCHKVPVKNFYVCRHEHCEKKGKIWTRWDNLKTHLRDVHKLHNEEPDSYCRKNYAPQDNDLAGLVPHPTGGVVHPLGLNSTPFDALSGTDFGEIGADVLEDHRDYGNKHGDDSVAELQRLMSGVQSSSVGAQLEGASESRGLSQDPRNSFSPAATYANRQLQNLQPSFSGDFENIASQRLDGSLSSLNNLRAAGDMSMFGNGDPFNHLSSFSATDNAQDPPQSIAPAGAPRLSSDAIVKGKIPKTPHSTQTVRQIENTREISMASGSSSTLHVSKTDSLDGSVTIGNQNFGTDNERPTLHTPSKDLWLPEKHDPLFTTEDGSEDGNYNSNEEGDQMHTEAEPVKKTDSLIDIDSDNAMADQDKRERLDSTEITTKPDDESHKAPSREDVDDIEAWPYTRLRDVIKRLHENGKLVTIVKDLGFQTTDVPTSSSAATQSIKSEQTTTKDAKLKNFPCEDDKCEASFTTMSAVRKHMKRHERPYSCTFAKCNKNKSFGSKNDWKRHEETQHIQPSWDGEVWQCSESPEASLSSGNKGKGSEIARICAEVFSSCTALQDHLSASHNVTDEKLLKVKVANGRSMPTNELRYWCGFCRKTIDLAEDVPPDFFEIVSKNNYAGSKSNREKLTSISSFLRERFDHIDNHFSGRPAPKRDISQWMDGGPSHPNLRKGIDVKPADSDARNDNASRKRSRSDDEQHDTNKGGPTSKKQSKKPVLWFCCRCENYYRAALTSSCHNGCGHRMCDSCGLE